MTKNLEPLNVNDEYDSNLIYTLHTIKKNHKTFGLISDPKGVNFDDKLVQVLNC